MDEHAEPESTLQSHEGARSSAAWGNQWLYITLLLVGLVVTGLTSYFQAIAELNTRIATVREDLANSYVKKADLETQQQELKEIRKALTELSIIISVQTETLRNLERIIHKLEKRPGPAATFLFWRADGSHAGIIVDPLRPVPA